MSKKPSISFAFPIESVSRKFIQRDKTCCNTTSTDKIKYDWLGGMVKPAPAYSKGVANNAKNFLVFRSRQRTSPYTANELALREEFSAVATAVAARLKDPAKQAADIAAWKAQEKYNTLRGYVWAREAAAYEESQG